MDARRLGRSFCVWRSDCGEPLVGRRSSARSRQPRRTVDPCPLHWLVGGSRIVSQTISGYRALPMLYGLFEGVQSLYSLVAGANGGAPDSDIDQRVQAVLKEVGKDKLQKALSNPDLRATARAVDCRVPLP